MESDEDFVGDRKRDWDRHIDREVMPMREDEIKKSFFKIIQ